MRLRTLIILVVISGTAAFWGCGSSATGPVPPAGTELEGSWFSYDSLFHVTFTFADTNWTVFQEYWNDQDTTLTWNGSFSLSTVVSPKTIDLLCSGSPYSGDIGQVALGIYALNSSATACTLAINDIGDTVRPVEFGSHPIVLDKQ